MSGSEARTCRVCGETYPYPAEKSLATRSCCERCASIPREVQRVFERMRRQIERLSREVEALKREA